MVDVPYMVMTEMDVDTLRLDHIPFIEPASSQLLSSNDKTHIPK